MSLLSVHGLNLSFGGHRVVEGLSFDIQPGEKLALVGESGSGKSVTALAILRLLEGAQITGSIAFSSREDPSVHHELLSLSEREMRAIRGRDIGMVFQEPMTALNPLLTVGAQVAEVLVEKEALSRAQAWARAVELLARTGIPEPERRAAQYPHQLSGGQRQRAMIAMALACRPRLLLADEPTTALDVQLRGRILDLIEDLRRETGMAVLLITHDLNLVRRFADRVVVMQRGRLVEQGVTEALLSAPRQAYTRELVASRPARAVVEAPLPPETEPLVKAEGLRVSYPVPIAGVRGWFKQGEFVALEGADFTVPPGRTLGVVGESGSGKSTLAQAVLGLLPHGGALSIAGRQWQGRVAADRPLRRIAQVVFQDPFSSLSPRMTVEEIVGEGLRVHEPGLAVAERRARVQNALRQVGLDETAFPALLSRYPHEFSGGQRQRLAVARALIVNPQLVVLDEPTSALDVTIQHQVLALLQGLQRERGLAYLLITHDLAVVAAMAHEVLVLKDGQVVERGTVRQVMAEPRHAYTRLLVETLNR